MVVLAALTASSAFGQPPAPRPDAARPKPQPPGPVFRAGVELVPIDVTALDSNGRQVTDLTAADFQVEIDGDRRDVATVEYIRSADPLRVIGTPAKSVVRDETYWSANIKGAPSGRLIVLLIDHDNIRTGTARSAMNSARKFVDTLTPDDRVSVVAVPSPGELVDFTTDHDKVREALLRIVGTGDPTRTRFNLSITEAIAIYMRSDLQLALEVLLRECAAAAPSDAERCEREVEQDAGEIMSDIRRRTQNSLNGFRAVLRGLTALEGPKSVILVSEGLIFEGLGSETEELALLAADARASLDVLLLDVPRFDASQARRPNTPREDRELQVQGLEQLAGAARGEVYRINTSADFAFERISRALDGYYLLGVESRPNDRNGRRHRIGVKTTRRGVSIRARRTFLSSVSAKTASPVDAVSRALRSPLPINDLPLKMSTWIYKEPGTTRVRVLVAAEVERLANQSLDYTVGMAIVNKQGKGVAPASGLKTLAAKTGDEGTAVFSGMLAVEPGEYRVILAMADSEGRVGSVTRSVTAFQLDGPGVSVGDLIVGRFAGGGKTALEPAIEPVISGVMAAVMEAYTPRADGLEGALEIVAEEDGAPLARIPMRVDAGVSTEVATMSAQFDTGALPPGRYLARGVVTHNGTTQGHMLRPFRVAAVTTSAGSTVAPGAVPSDMTMALVRAIGSFDRKELLAPTLLTAVFAAADGHAGASKAAIKEARSGDFGGAAMTALGEGDQALAMFFKGLELYQLAQLEKAAVQFQNSMQLAPAFSPSRIFLGAALAESNRHKEAAGLLQSAASTPANATVARIAGEQWLKAGQPGLAIGPLELAARQPDADMRAKKLLGIAYVLGGRPVDAVDVLTPYLDANPADAAALLAALYGTYHRHLDTPQAATLASDRANMTKWAKSYAAAKGPLQPLVAAWVTHVLTR